MATDASGVQASPSSSSPRARARASGATSRRRSSSSRGVTILERALRNVFDAADPAQVDRRRAGEQGDPGARRSCSASRGSHPTMPSSSRAAKTRQLSVAAGLAVLADGVEIVLVHDAARALTPSSQFDRVVRAVAPGLRHHPGAPGERHRQAGERRRPRARDRRPPRPRARADAAGLPARRAGRRLRAARPSSTRMTRRSFAATGRAVAVVEGEATAFKITTPWDLRRAEKLLGTQRRARAPESASTCTATTTRPRSGSAALYWPDEAGLAGHSDGDADDPRDLRRPALGRGARRPRRALRHRTIRGSRAPQSAVFLRETLAPRDGRRLLGRQRRRAGHRQPPEDRPASRSELEGRLTELRRRAGQRRRHDLRRARLHRRGAGPGRGRDRAHQSADARRHAAERRR